MRRVLFLSILALFIHSCGGGQTSTTDSEEALVNQEMLIDSREITYEDPYRKYLWHIEYPSDSSFVYEYYIQPDSSSNVSQAWEISNGEGVLVAVIDNGFDVNHEDLKDNIVLTYNIANKNSDVRNYDTQTHGTATAGLIVASSNSVGGIGIAPKAKVVLIQDSLLSTDANMVEAFDYAQKSGAKVVNCSWGTNSVSDVVASKIRELYDNGIVVVFASGNDGMSLERAGINDESELATVLGVGSSNEFNNRSSYSSYGSSIDILAPSGEYIGVVSTDEYGYYQLGDRLGLLDNGYTFFSGTSASAPIVSGVVALMLSANPNLTPDQVREIIITTAQKIGGVDYIAGWNRKYAYGKIDAYAAVLAAKNYGN